MSDGQGHRITSDVEKGVSSVSKAVGSHRCCNLSKQCRVEVHLVEQNESRALGNAHVRVRFDAIDVHARMSEPCMRLGCICGHANIANQRSWYEQENGVGLGVVRVYVHVHDSQPVARCAARCSQ
jgi:hypothetical protein